MKSIQIKSNTLRSRQIVKVVSMWCPGCGKVEAPRDVKLCFECSRKLFPIVEVSFEKVKTPGRK